jgi:hypothetical protein
MGLITIGVGHFTPNIPTDVSIRLTSTNRRTRSS